MGIDVCAQGQRKLGEGRVRKAQARRYQQVSFFLSSFFCFGLCLSADFSGTDFALFPQHAACRFSSWGKSRLFFLTKRDKILFCTSTQKIPRYTEFSPILVHGVDTACYVALLRGRW